MIWLGCLALLVVVLFVIAAIVNRRKGAGALYVIENPVIGFANFAGPKYDHLVAEDRAAFGRLFNRSVESDAEIPLADALFVYADVTEDGDIAGPEASFRRIAPRAGARLVVLASPNSEESFHAAIRKTGPQHAGLVFTLDRNGTAFSLFFAKVFALMHEGRSIADAWVSVSPQIPGRHNPDSAQMVFVTDGAVIAFKSTALDTMEQVR